MAAKAKPKAKPSSKHSTTLHNRYMRVMSHIRDLHSQTISFKFTFEEYLAKRQGILDSLDYKRLTYYYKGIVTGYGECFRDSLYHTHLEWRHWANGKFILPEDMPKEGVTYNMIDTDKSRHVWKSDPTKVW